VKDTKKAAREEYRVPVVDKRLHQAFGQRWYDAHGQGD
jgi:hypothetical protein